MIPIALILMLSIDFIKNVISGNEDEIQKNLKLALNRIKMAVFIFLLPTVINVFLGILDGADIKYINCLTNANLDNINYYQLLEEQSFEEDLKDYSEPKKTMDIPKKIDNTTKEDDTVNIYFLDVGIGDCIIIENNKKFGMIDTGYKYTSKSVYKFMKKLKIKELEFLIITHNHANHVGGFDIINKKFKIKKLYIEKARLKASEKTGMKAYNSIIKKATKSKTKVKDVAASGKGSFKMGNIKLKFYSRKKFKIYDDTVIEITLIV